jgi:Flp pilus assembly secretin CpaC
MRSDNGRGISGMKSMSTRIVPALLLSLLLESVAAQQQQSELTVRTEQSNGASSVSATCNGSSNAQSGIRIAQAPTLLQMAPNPLYGIRATTPSSMGEFQKQSIGFNNRGKYGSQASIQSDKFVPKDQIYIYHQPLIQIKLRIIEVLREDNLVAKTVIDYIQQRAGNSNIDAHKITGAGRGTATATRFPDGGLLNVPGLNSGSGGILNVTTEHLNFITELLATEFKADMITCPQVVTLNGQKVELLSGANVPFQLGQSVLHDGTIAVQDMFYKHVGTDLTVTPRIIDWGPRGEGAGERPIVAKDIRNWNALAGFLYDENILEDTVKVQFKKYVGTALLMPVADQLSLLDYLNANDRASILTLLNDRRQSNPSYPYPIELLFNPLDCDQIPENGCPCSWHPSNCTLDIELILRQSAKGTSPTLNLAADPNQLHTEDLGNEVVAAAISDVVQLKSGRGAVIGGLIGERDVQASSKVPVLGDLPWVGAAFRQKSTNRQKSEIVILLEAEILPPEPCEGREVAAADFELTKNYLHRDVLCNPLDAGLQRTGIGGYLPPRSCDEKIYWERLGRNVQQACTAVQDTFR